MGEYWCYIGWSGSEMEGWSVNEECCDQVVSLYILYNISSLISNDYISLYSFMYISSVLKYVVTISKLPISRK